ncbi:hypothetical protein Tcan_10478 [Toxocara canis]|uniref:Uncharacterized protein n=1 Tax=Toxocara canis TaxID=6265 RepID=A0A0B2V6E2_TOXCA|nr:hypothetical protein Tcan_10478 [Toxocara canis]
MVEVVQSMIKMLLLHVIGFSIFTQSTNAFYGSFSNVPTTNINCLLANSAGNTVMAPSPQVGQQAELICNVELRQGGHAFCCCYISWQGQPVVTYGIAQGPSLLPQKNCILINAGRDTPPNLNWTYVIGNVANASGQAMGRPSTQIDNSEANTKMATSTISSIAGGENHVELRQGGHAFCCCYISWQGQPVVTYGIAQGPSLLPQKNCILINAGRDTPPNLNWTYVIGNVANASGQAMGRPSTQIDNSEANTKMATSTISSIAGGENHVQSSVPNENRNGHTVSHENICSSKFSVSSVLFVIFIAECF